jgi:hypothetical protein
MAAATSGGDGTEADDPHLMKRRMSRSRYVGTLAALFGALAAVGSGSYYTAAGISGTSPSSGPSLPPAFGSERGPGSSHCGKERWPVKTLTDADAGTIDFIPVDSTIGELGSVPAPSKVGKDLARQPQEEHVYRVEGSIVAFKLEADSDIHLAIADPAGAHPTMIAEFPGSNCDTDALDKAEMDKARQDFVAAYGRPTGQFKKPTGCAVLTGVFFFDRIHGQLGVAPNGAELHPVLDFQNVSSQNCTPNAGTTTGETGPTATSTAATTSTTASTPTTTTP